MGSVRDIVMVLGKAIGKQPRGQELPSHEDPVWAKLGPLGGVQFALEVVMKHTRVRRQGAGCLIGCRLTPATHNGMTAATDGLAALHGGGACWVCWPLAFLQAVDSIATNRRLAQATT